MKVTSTTRTLLCPHTLVLLRPVLPEVPASHLFKKNDPCAANPLTLYENHYSFTTRMEHGVTQRFPCKYPAPCDHRVGCMFVLPTHFVLQESLACKCAEFLLLAFSGSTLWPSLVC